MAQVEIIAANLKNNIKDSVKKIRLLKEYVHIVE